MKPKIEKTSVGSITLNKKSFEYDIIVHLDGKVEKRKKKLSKKIFGTSHKVLLK